MARPRPFHSDNISAEEVRLRKQQEELLRKEEVLKQKLRTLPAQMQARKKREVELAKLRAVAAPEAISLGSAARGRSRSKPSVKRRTRVGEIQSARLKFLFLCLILATFVILLCHSIPG